MQTRILLVLFLILQLSCSSDPDQERAVNYLKQEYELKSDKLESFAKKSFIAKGQRPALKRIKLDFTESKTGYKFYSTSLRNTLGVTPRSRLIVASPKSEDEAIFEIRSMNTSDDLSQFIDLFEGIKIPSSEEQETLIQELSKLMESLSSSKKINNLEAVSFGFSADLLVNEQKSKKLNFFFDSDEFTNVQFLNPQ